MRMTMRMRMRMRMTMRMTTGPWRTHRRPSQQPTCNLQPATREPRPAGWPSLEPEVDRQDIPHRYRAAVEGRGLEAPLPGRLEGRLGAAEAEPAEHREVADGAVRADQELERHRALKPGHTRRLGVPWQHAVEDLGGPKGYIPARDRLNREDTTAAATR